MQPPLDPPEKEEAHDADCPLSSDRPWRPAKCTCYTAKDAAADRADARRKGEL